MAYPYTTGEYPGRQFKKRPPPKKREERDEGRPPFEEPGIGAIAALPWTYIKEDIEDNFKMKPARIALVTKRFERDTDGNIKLDKDGKPISAYKRDSSGKIVRDASGEPVKEDQEDIVVGDERAVVFDPLKPTSWIGAAKKFTVNAASWNAISGQVEAKVVWDDYLMKQELGDLFYEKDTSGNLKLDKDGNPIVKEEARRVRDKTLTFAQRGRIPSPTRFRGPYDDILYDGFFLGKMETVLRDSGFEDDANLIRKCRDETADFDNSLEGKALKDLDKADGLRARAEAVDPATGKLFEQRAKMLEARVQGIYGVKLGIRTPRDVARVRGDLQAKKDAIVKPKANVRPELRSQARGYVGGAYTGYSGSLDRVRDRFKNHLANGRLEITKETEDFIKFFNLLEYRKLQFELGFLLNSWDRGKTFPGKVYNVVKARLYWNWWLYNMGLSTGKYSGFYPPRLYSLLVHPSVNLGERRLDRALRKFFTRETKSGHVYLWDFENWVVSRRFLPSFLFKGLAKNIVSKNSLTGVEEFLENQNFWSLKGLSDFLVKYRGKSHGLLMKGLRAAPRLGLPVAVLGGRGAWLQYALRKGIGKLVTKAISVIAGTAVPVVGAVVTEVTAWVGGKVLKKAWKKPEEAAAYVLGGCGCGCLTIAAPIVLVMLAMMAIIPGMKKYQYGAGIPTGGGETITFEGVPNQVIDDDEELPDGYEELTECPVDSNRVTSDFGWRCDPSPCHFHYGTDIDSTSDGDPVRAIGDGTVIEVYTGANPDDTYGNYIRIQHNGYISLYGHLGEVYVSVGQTVSAGDIIGTVNNSGDSTGPHLHLGIMVLGEGYVDPCRVLPQCCD